MSESTVTKLPEPGPDAITDDLDGWTKVAGTPTMKTWVMHTTADGTMISGVWEATPGTYRTAYESFEFVHLLAGELIITPDGEKPIKLKAGDAFVVEPGFAGTWEIVSTVRKHFTAGA